MVASNIDNVIIINSIEKPSFNNRLVDRFIVSGESSHLKIIIVINKIDLDTKQISEYWKDVYSDIGYPVYLTNMVYPETIQLLKSELKGRVSLFCGQSGVGKSTILNIIDPDLNLKIGEVSEATSKGTHTTVTALMEKIHDDTYVIDTPGIREFDPYGISKENLGHYFREFAVFLSNCRFNTCTHYHEPGCAVVKAVERGEISEERYESYLNILESIEEDMFI